MSRVRVVQPERRSHADNFTVSLVRPGVEDNDGDVGALVVSKVSKRFGRTTILDGVDLTVVRGEVVALTGEN